MISFHCVPFYEIMDVLKRVSTMCEGGLTNNEKLPMINGQAMMLLISGSHIYDTHIPMLDFFITHPHI